MAIFLQMARIGTGGLAALLLGKGLDLSTEDAGHEVLTYVVFYGTGAAFVAATAVLSIVIYKRNHRGAQPPSVFKRDLAAARKFVTDREANRAYKDLKNPTPEEAAWFDQKTNRQWQPHRRKLYEHAWKASRNGSDSAAAVLPLLEDRDSDDYHATLDAVEKVAE
jgi:hypothetical protein